MSRSAPPQVVTAAETCALIPDGATVATSGFAGIGHAEHVTWAFERRFIETGHPRGVTLVHAAGQSDMQGNGIDHFAHEGLLTRVIGGHFRLAPGICAMVRENLIEAYNFPQGVITHLYREIAAKRAGVLTHAGLDTFVDPRLEGGKMTPRTTDDLIHVVNAVGREWLLYQAFPIDVALMRLTVADPRGNLAEPREASKLEALPLAQAARNSGGIVIAQVETLLDTPLKPHDVSVPGLYVDYIVVAPPEHHRQTPDYDFNPAYVGEAAAASLKIAPLPLDMRKVIARRAAMQLFDGAVVNLGIGIPEAIAAVAYEEGVFDRITLSVESGILGGVPAGNLSFGASSNPVAFVAQHEQFDFYSGGGLDLAFLGLAEFDADGNVNVSRFADVIAGCGGFIEISQNAREVVFCGTLTASRLQATCENGALRLAHEGQITKAKERVQQITFSGDQARRRKLPVHFVTERCVFELRANGITLTEIVPGVSLEHDILAQMEFKPLIAERLREMPASLFRPTPMGLTLKPTNEASV